jgi:hypothetical protein
MRSSITYRQIGRIVFGLVVFLSLSGAVLFAQDEVGQNAIKISVRSSQNANPKICVTADQRIYVVWEGLDEGHSRIFFRENRDGEWQDELMLDPVTDGDDMDPAIAVDVKGNPHVVWIRKQMAGTAAERTIVIYAYRLGQEWIIHGAINPNSDCNSEFPVIAVASDTRVLIAWQEGRGTDYDILSATQDRGGDFAIIKVAGWKADHYNLYPEVFLSNPPLLVWYEAVNTDFILRKASFQIGNFSWKSEPIANFDRLAANRLPYILADNGGETFFGLWYDAERSGERIFLGVQDPETRGEGQIVDDNPARSNRLPSGAIAEDGTIYTCWCGDTLYGTQIFVLEGNGDYFSPSIMVSDGEPLYYSHPHIAIRGASTVYVVWSSNALDGGDGGIYFNTVEF